MRDNDHYVEMASSFADRGVLENGSGQPSAEREPGYPIFLAFVFKLFGRGYLSFLLAQCALSIGMLGLAYVLAVPWLGRPAALLAAAFGAFYPPFVYYCSLPARENWMVFIDLGSLWFLLRALREGRSRDFLWAGLCAGVSALTHTTYLPFGLLAGPLTAMGTLGRPWKRFGARAGIYLAAFIMLYSLWPLYNYHRFHRWILGSTAASGDHFYMFMIVPEEIGGTPQHDQILRTDAAWQAGMKLPPVDQSGYFWKEGFRKIRNDPGAYGKVVAWRFFWDQWRFAPRPREYRHSYRLLWWVGLLSDGWLIPVAFLGIWLSRLRRLEAILGFAFIVSISFTYSLVLTMLRYRLIIMPWMMMFAALAFREVWECRKSR